MNIDIWAAMQSVDVLEAVDRLIPDLVKKTGSRRLVRRGRQVVAAHDRVSTVGAGVSLVVLGTLMLIPGPVDIVFGLAGAAVGGALFGPVGAFWGFGVGIAIYNIMAVIVIAVGVVMIVSGLLGL